MKEYDIRPKKLFEKYLSLSQKDVKSYFSFKNLKKNNCISCNRKTIFAFEKNSFHFDECQYCNTLFVNPRPKIKDFQNYYRYSKSVSFWKTFYASTAKSRKKKIWSPKVKLILSKINKTNNKILIDIGGGYGVFGSMIKKHFNNDIIIIEPNQELAKVCRKKNLFVIEKFFEDIKSSDLNSKKNRVFTCFELVEHLHDVKKFFKKVKNIMKKGDLFIFSTLSSLGFDILTLGKDSKSVFPPHHLNFLNPYSTNLLLKKIGFKQIDIITPGELDVDITINNQKYIKDKFVQNFIKFSSIKTKKDFQKFLKENNFSSHMIVFCKT